MSVAIKVWQSMFQESSVLVALRYLVFGLVVWHRLLFAFEGVAYIV